jgi:hypothetical protein
MSRGIIRVDSDDFMRGLLVTQQAGALPYEMRKKTNSASELTFASAHALLLVNETLSVAAILDTGLKLLVAPNEATTRERLKPKIKHSTAAQDLLRGDHYAMNAIVVVNLCTALEVGIEDTILVALRFLPGLAERLGLVTAESTQDRDLSYDEASKAYDRLEQWASKEIKRRPPEEKLPPAKWLAMLRAVGLEISLSGEESAAICEMLTLRHCIVHRASRSDGADQGLQIGERFRVEKTAMGRFSNASLKLATELARAALTPALGNRAAM